MQTTVESTDKHKVKLTIEVPQEEFAKDLDAAYRSIAKQVRIPGFRKGKVPRQVIDAKVGREAVMEEFLHDAVPVYFRNAVRDEDLAPITDPDIDLRQAEDGKPLVFTAEVEVRPRLELSDWKGVQVEKPSSEVSEADVDEWVESLRDRFAELETVGRPAREGDYVLADVHGTVAGEEVEGLTRPDYLYSIGSGEFGEEMDKQLQGKRPGDILTFTDKLIRREGEERTEVLVSFRILVKEVRAKKLPVADDEFAKTASEFDTLGELREDLKGKLHELKEREARATIRDLALQAMVERVDVDLPDTLIDEEVEHRVAHAEERARRAGSTLDEVLADQGWDQARLRDDARDHAVRAVKSDLVLEAIARSEKMEVTADEIGAEIAVLAKAYGRDAKDLAKQLDRTGQIVTLAGDIIRTKALDLLVEQADIREGPTNGPEAATESATAGEDEGGSEEEA